jgi:hypothetical protein
MPLSVLFWVLFVIMVLWRGWLVWPGGAAPGRPWNAGADLLMVVLIFLLGLRAFGAIITGG